MKFEITAEEPFIAKNKVTILSEELADIIRDVLVDESLRFEGRFVISNGDRRVIMELFEEN